MASNTLDVTFLCSGPGAIPLISKTSYNIVALTAGNFAAQQTAATTLAEAENALSVATLRQNSIAVVTIGSLGYPTVPANRGQKWIVSAQNALNEIFTYTIPAAAVTGNVDADGITALETSTAWSDYITAFNAVATDPSGASLQFARAKLGGRRR